MAVWNDIDTIPLDRTVQIVTAIIGGWWWGFVQKDGKPQGVREE